jgi:hypothetical protein
LWISDAIWQQVGTVNPNNQSARVNDFLQTELKIRKKAKKTTLTEDIKGEFWINCDEREALVQ